MPRTPLRAYTEERVMSSDPDIDVPSPIDLRSMVDARDWTDSAMLKRPWREEFFHRIAQELACLDGSPCTVLELGSGPGFLAQWILEALSSVDYIALDFSASMHTLAKECLGDRSRRVQFVEADFRFSNWIAGLPKCYAIVTMQAVHELRHKRHAGSLYKNVRELLHRDGVFLMCDHFVGDGGMTNTELYMTPEEHVLTLEAAGFVRVELLLRKGGRTLYKARNRAA